LANSKNIWGVNSTRSLSNEGEAIREEYWLELGDDKTRKDDDPEAGTKLEVTEPGRGGYLHPKNTILKVSYAVPKLKEWQRDEERHDDMREESREDVCGRSP
jgi:hypothetical protein